MARPRIFDYDVSSEEEVVTEGVEGAMMTWFGLDIENQRIHIVCSEGTLNGTGDGIESVTRSGQQVSMEGTPVNTFYAAHKAALDEIIQAALETWASNRSKTGEVIIS